MIRVRAGDRCPICTNGRILAYDAFSDTFTCDAGRWHGYVELHYAAAAVENSRTTERMVRADPSRFPHKCPRCGTHAYIGHNVEHADSELDETCR